MIYLDNTTDTQEIFIPRKAVEPEYSPMNRPLDVFIDNVKVQDNVMTYLRTVEPQSKDEGYSTVTVSMNVPMTYQNLKDNGVFQFNEPVGTVEVNVETTTEGGGSCNLGQLNAEFEDRLDGECWWYADEYGVDGFNYVSINASAYGSQMYNQGFADGVASTQLEFESDKWGIVGYYNDWGNKPDTYFNYTDIELYGLKVQVVRDFYCDGTEIKVRYNNSWAQSFSADLYNEPQIRPLVVSDMNMQLSEGYWDIYLLGNEDENGVFGPQYILVMYPGSDIPENLLWGYDNFTSSVDANWVITNDWNDAVQESFGASVGVPDCSWGNTIAVEITADGYEPVYDIINWTEPVNKYYDLVPIQ